MFVIETGANRFNVTETNKQISNETTQNNRLVNIQEIDAFSDVCISDDIHFYSRLLANQKECDR